MVTETPPERWQQGTRHCVIVHLEEIHDYTASTIDDKGNISPGIRCLPNWHLGVVDGEQVPARAFEEFPHHPPPPRRHGPSDKVDQRGRRLEDRPSKGPKGRYNNDHPDFYRGHRKHHDDDNDDSYGRRGREAPGRHAWGERTKDGPYRERERDRSPQRRVWGHGNRYGGQQRTADHDTQAPLKLPTELPQVSTLQVTKETDLQRLFKTQAFAIQDAVQRIPDWTAGHGNQKMASSLRALMHDYIDKACALAEGLGLLPLAAQAAVNEAWSKRQPQATVPARSVFDRILNALPASTTMEDKSIAEVEEALARMELAAKLVPTVQAHGGEPASSQQQAIGVAGLFSKPLEPVLQQPTSAVTPPAALNPPAASTRRNRRQRTFDMSSVRRSARLAAARPMTQMQRAQRNLCRKLGFIHDELEPVETALQEYIAMFKGPLPQDVIAALTEIFNIGTEDACEAEEALLRMVGEGVEELQDAVVAIAAA
ncbi:uncharacterized protein LOC110429646 [Sorghum bicolor]|uniref:uncharacterized protein LOC110429646 n=1 Tax=Sorghum bicolor TaxID=4558 RepID=UPI000B4250D2|nr:uncharacterized protein LOC110429646 [Sorghum bicolor]|eukprot:XP_021301578.1 uncharacterized protein LOC110429646 [Sorghum bicolor]